MFGNQICMHKNVHGDSVLSISFLATFALLAKETRISTCLTYTKMHCQDLIRLLVQLPHFCKVLSVFLISLLPVSILFLPAILKSL